MVEITLKNIKMNKENDILSFICYLIKFIYYD